MSLVRCCLALIFSAALASADASPRNTQTAAAASAGRIQPGATAAEAYAAIASSAQVELAELPLAGGPTAMLLERCEVFSEDALIILQTSDGPRSAPLPSLATFRSPAGDATLRAFLAVSPEGIYGVLRTPTEQLILSTGPAGSGLPLAAATPEALLADATADAEPACGTDLLPENAAILPLPHDGDGGVAGGGIPCRRVRIAYETDNEYLSNLFGGNTTAAAAYIATLTGAVSEIYFRDVNAVLEVAYVRLWTSPDPWNAESTSGQLYQFQSTWNTQQGSVQRNLAHFLSGRGLGGGVAFLNAICDYGSDYGLSANLNGSFPYPIQNNNGANWDLMVVAHEFGHNFGAPHTHGMSPPVDCCGGAYGGTCGGVQDCSSANVGTIMSYCHICPGGMANVRMEFHPRTISEHIAPFLGSSSTDLCLARVPGATITAQPASVQAPAGSSVSFTVSATSPAALLYQWRKGGENIYDGPRVTGTATPTLQITDIVAGDAGAYDCVVSSECGVVVSNVANLTIGAAGCPGNRGDANCDGIVDFFDIDPLLLALFDPPAYLAGYCGGALCTVDADCNDTVDFFDIDPFVDCLFSGCANCP